MKFLFTAHLRDGSILTQTAADISTIDKSKSAFFDVIQRLDDVVMFTLSSDHDEWSVDLTDGVFSHNGARFIAGDPSTPAPEGKRKLIYFRRVSRHFNSAQVEVASTVVFHVGYQISGTAYQIVLGVI